MDKNALVDIEAGKYSVKTFLAILDKKKRLISWLAMANQLFCGKVKIVGQKSGNRQQSWILYKRQHS